MAHLDSLEKDPSKLVKKPRAKFNLVGSLVRFNRSQCLIRILEVKSASIGFKTSGS